MPQPITFNISDLEQPKTLSSAPITFSSSDISGFSAAPQADESDRMGEGEGVLTRPLQTYLGFGKYRKGATGIEKGAEEFASGLVSPLSIGLMAVTGGLGGLAEAGAAEGAEAAGSGLFASAGRQVLSKFAPETAAQIARSAGVASKLANIGFTGQQIWNTMQAVPRVSDAIKAGDTDTALEEATQALLGGGMAAWSAKHLITPHGNKVSFAPGALERVIGASDQPIREYGVKAKAFEDQYEKLIKNKPMDLAAYFYHEADGDPAVLENHRQQILDSHDASPAIKEKYSRIIDQALNLPQEYKDLSSALAPEYQNDWLEMKAMGRIDEKAEARPYYAGTHEYDPKDEANSDVRPSGRLTKTPAFAKTRSFDTLADAISAGFEPKDLGLAASRSKYIRRFGEMKSILKAEEQLLKETDADGRPIAIKPGSVRNVGGKRVISFGSFAIPMRSIGDVMSADDVIPHIGGGGDYAILQAENPQNEKLDQSANNKLTAQLLTDLTNKGYRPIPVEGHTKDVEGEVERAFFVPNIRPEDAAELGRKYNQWGILTSRGLHNLADDEITPVDTNRPLSTGDDARKNQYFTVVKKADGSEVPFNVPLDFDRTYKNSPSTEPRALKADVSANHYLIDAANSYSKNNGLRSIDRSRVPVDARAEGIAKAYERMSHNPNDPAVQKSYSALIDDIKKQWDYATKTLGYTFEPSDTDPYKNSTEMIKDVRDNKHLSFFRGGDMPGDHPLAKVDPTTGLSYNDMFRAVHDLFGHAAEGFEFGPKGEENAWNIHRQMFSKAAIPALTTETKGQNSWVNFGDHLRNAEGKLLKQGEEGFIPKKDRPYAQQKAGLLPKEYWTRPDDVTPRGSTVPLLERPSATRQRVEDVAKVIKNYTEGQKLPVLELSSTAPEKMTEQARRLGRSELVPQMASTNSGRDWYGRDIQQMHDAFAELHPELKGNPRLQRFLTSLISAASLGNDSPTTMSNANDIYTEFKRTGKIPSTRPDGGDWGGEHPNSNRNVLANLQKIYEHVGSDPEKLQEWLLTKHPVSELNDLLGKVRKIPGKATDMKYGAAALSTTGKAGNFFLNMNGITDVMTMDKWAARTWNRWMGTLINEDGSVQEAPRNDAERRLAQSAFKELADEYGLTIPQTQALMWFYERNLWKSQGLDIQEGLSYGKAARDYVNKVRPEGVAGGGPEATAGEPTPKRGGLHTINRENQGEVPPAASKGTDFNYGALAEATEPGKPQGPLQKQLTDTYHDLPKIGDNPVFDVGNRLTKAEFEYFSNHPAVQKVVSEISDVAREAIDQVRKSGLAKGTMLGEDFGNSVKRVGTILSHAVHGLYGIDPNDVRNATLFIDPFNRISKDPASAASLIWHTIKHELLHDVIKGHDEEFTTAEASLARALGSKFETNALERLTKVYADPADESRLHPELENPIRIYEQSRLRREGVPVLSGGEAVRPGIQPQTGREAAGFAGVQPSGEGVVRPVEAAQVDPGKVVPGENGARHVDVSDYREGPDVFMRNRMIGINQDDEPMFERKPLLIHPEHLDAVNKAFADSSWFRKNPIMSNLLSLSSGAKRSLLSLSPFHWNTEWLRGIQMGLSPLEAMNPGKLTPDRLAVKSKFGPTLVDTRAQSIADEGLGSGTLAQKIPFFGQYLHAIENKLFGDYIPRLKADAFEKVVSQLEQRHPNWKTDDVHYTASKIVDSAFGGLNWRMLGVSMNSQDALRLAMLAPDFTGSQVLFAKYGLQPGGSVVNQSLARIALYNFAVARVLNLMVSGKAHNEQPFAVVSPDEKKAWTVRTMPQDIAHALSDPRNFAYNRLNPLVARTGWEALTGRDERGKRVTAEKELMDLFKNVTPIPAQAFIPAFKRPGETVKEGVLRGVGATAIPNLSTAEKTAQNLASDHSESGPVDQARLARHQQLLQIEDDIRNNKMQPQDLYKMVETGQVHKDEAKTILNVMKETEGLTPKMAAFYTKSSRLPAPEFLEVYSVSTPEERQVIQPLLQKKARAYFKKTSDWAPEERMGDPTYRKLRSLLPDVAPF